MRLFNKEIYIFSILILVFTSCSNPSYKIEESQNENIFQLNSEEEKDGNKIADAIKQTHDLDIVLYPTDFLRRYNYRDKGASERDRENNIKAWEAAKDKFILGTMTGAEITRLITQRSQEKFETPFYVAGLRYHIHYVGGILRFANFANMDNSRFDMDRRYKVAISDAYLNNRQFYFPNYEFRNGLNFSFRISSKTISVNETLQNGKYREVKDLLSRSIVTTEVLGDLGEMPISKIQGTRFISDYLGYRVTTTGIVTAVGERTEFPEGSEIIIQSEKDDGNPLTSEAIKLHFIGFIKEPKLGDKVKVTGVVHEPMSVTGMSPTELWDISSFKTLSSNNKQPEPIFLSKDGGVIVPDEIISRFNGNLNDKLKLDTKDTIDFYESLEHMRIKIKSPRVLGFRGLREDLVDQRRSDRESAYITLYVKPDGESSFEGETDNGGLILDEENLNHSPEIMMITTGNFSKDLSRDHYYKVGDLIDGEVTGVFTYSLNIFGDGEYSIQTPIPQESLKKEPNLPTPLRERAQTTLVSDENSLTVATYNIENLGGDQDDRITDLAVSIVDNLKCPDIVNLVEIQDNNSIDFSGSTEADVTLRKIIDDVFDVASNKKKSQLEQTTETFYDRLKEVPHCSTFKYKSINIDPVAFNEGGQPGGSIRVAMIYNPNKVKFNPRPIPGPLADTLVMLDGSINHNPGRVFPNDPAFRRSRRSIVSEFEFKGQKIFVIGNHFNSKLGDSNLFGAIQPFVSGSENRRIPIATKINQFVRTIEKRSPGAGVIVLGDFNANPGETSMRVLKGGVLENLIERQEFVTKNNRYTTNHNGISSAIDYIFSNKALNDKGVELEVLNVNSDWMGRISDHDPLIAKYQF